MRFLLALLLLLPFGLNAATTFTEFYCDSSVGTNVNSGSTTNAAALYTSVSGNWTNATATFLPTDGLDSSTNVAVGDWVSIFVDGSTNLVQSGAGGWVAQVTNVTAGVNGKIMLSQAAFMGTKPSDLVAAATLKKGGAWNGPYGSIGFPFGFLATTATNAPNVFPRCNFKNTAQYNITAQMAHSLTGPVRWQGMNLTPGDGGKATFDGGTTGTSFFHLNATGVENDFYDLIFGNNGNSGSSGILSVTGARSTLVRCVAHDAWRAGISVAGNTVLVECEAYANNKQNSAAALGGFSISGPAVLIRCIAHDNAGSTTDGFNFGAANTTAIACISESNGKNGFGISGANASLISCDTYNNVSSGVDFTIATIGLLTADNCNFVKNGAYGITSSGSSLRNGYVVNCGFGSGTMTNASGSLAANLGGISEAGSVLYTADQTPWTDPTAGDFRISLTAAKSAGRGSFTQTAASYTGTIAYPDIGAAQSASTNAAASGGGSYTFAQ